MDSNRLFCYLEIKMKKIILILLVGIIGIGANAQRFTLSKHLITDTLRINDYFDDGADLTNKTSGDMVIKFRTYYNTVDTGNWDILYCSFPACRTYIAYEEICDTMTPGQKVRISNFSIEPKLTPKDCELCIEFFDMVDSTFRDTLCYKFGSRMDPAVGLADLVESKEAPNGVYPNPTSGAVKVKLANRINSIYVFDLSGKVVLSENNVLDRYKMVDLSELKPGSYVIQVEEEDGNVISERLIVQ
ncbi:MAG: hypothetical protein CL840_09085 [Crocinitomicaceae bacterium]|nr:hypothetical protein [Crocinitomicaceae bacterium]|tara:strand:- start:2212 stop:2946 length:735 start_codon:yes stop_codon:yes gene_type:complete